MGKRLILTGAGLIVAALAAGTVSEAQTPGERDTRRPDGTIINPIQSAPPPDARSGYDPNSPSRIEQENARRARAEENQRRLEEQMKSREAQLEQSRRGREGSAASPAGQAGPDRTEELEKTKRARDAAADTPVRRQP
jgi:hypothetical protein